jgi:hypothetical protein
MTCDSCPSLIVRKFANGPEVTTNYYCEIDGFCVSSMRFPLMECSRKPLPDPVPEKVVSIEPKILKKNKYGT